MPRSRSADAFNFQWSYLTFFGILPLNRPTKMKLLLHKCMFSLIGLGFPVTMTILAIITIFDSEDFEVKITSVYLISVHMVYLIKVTILQFKRKVLGRILSLFHHSSLTSYPEELDVFMKQSVRTSKQLLTGFQASVTKCGHGHPSKR